MKLYIESLRNGISRIFSRLINAFDYVTPPKLLSLALIPIVRSPKSHNPLHT